MNRQMNSSTAAEDDAEAEPPGLDISIACVEFACTLELPSARVHALTWSERAS